MSMKNRVQYLLMFLPLIFLHACSDKQMYDAIQNRQKVLCQEGPRSEYQNCMEQTEESYDAYKKARDETDDTK